MKEIIYVCGLPGSGKSYYINKMYPNYVIISNDLIVEEYAKKHNIHIYNATRGGNLEIFPRVKLEDVLSKKMEESK